MHGKRKSILAAWFALTREEQWLVAGILGLALLGLTARYRHLRQEQPDPVAVPALSNPAPPGAQE